MLGTVLTTLGGDSCLDFDPEKKNNATCLLTDVLSGQVALPSSTLEGSLTDPGHGRRAGVCGRRDR